MGLAARVPRGVRCRRAIVYSSARCKYYKTEASALKGRRPQRLPGDTDGQPTTHAQERVGETGARRLGASFARMQDAGYLAILRAAAFAFTVLLAAPATATASDTPICFMPVRVRLAARCYRCLASKLI